MSRTSVIHDLRRTVDRLPLPTRVAMLEGIDAERIIVGAYTDQSGGVCPMLAAHRRGGRTSFLQFARTWDRFTRAPKRGSRTATPREVSILRRHLVASIAASEELLPDIELADAIADHQKLVGRTTRAGRRRAAAPAATRTRIAPTVRLPSWMRPLGSVAEYERVLAEVGRQHVLLGLVDDTARRPAAASAVTAESSTR